MFCLRFCLFVCFTYVQVVDLVSHTKDTLGPVDILINCAGLGFYTTMKNCNLEEWEKMVDVNCKVRVFQGPESIIKFIWY